MSNNPLENPSDEAMLNAKENVVKTFAESASELGVSDKVKFVGFYSIDSTERAGTIHNRIKYNEKYLYINQEELERWSYHELQHAINHTREAELCTDLSVNDKSKMLYAFVLHPSFKDLYTRILDTYTEGIEKGYTYGKTVKVLPKRYSETELSSEDYADPGEVLALLRGYQYYLKQVAEGKNPKTVPPELTEAFKPEDLKFLDEDYRELLWKEIKEKDPTLLETKRGKFVREAKEQLI